MRKLVTVPRRVIVNDQSLPAHILEYHAEHFRALLDKPARGAFTMPALGRLSLTTAIGASDGWIGATLTGPIERVITVPPMNPGGRRLIGLVEYGTRVEPNYPFVVELEVAYCEWQLISVSC